MFKYFKGIETLEELKRAYRSLALKHHPDRKGGDKVIFQEMLNEYEKTFLLVKNNFKSGNGEPYTKENKERCDTYTNIINAIIKYSVTIDIVGSWLWVYGSETVKIKELLKSLGFSWSRARKKWYYNGNKSFRYSKTSMSYENIKNAYGWENIQTTQNKEASAFIE